jgi:antirestriction protein ArdC
MGQTAAEVLTASILADLEAGNLPPWQKPWRMSADAPRNATTGKAYRGANVWLLLLTAQNKGYTDPRWLTYNQAQSLGGSVLRGEKGTPVVFWKMTVKHADNADGETVESRSAMLRFYTVFNVAQTEGCKLADLPPAPPAPDPIDAAEAIVAGMPNPPRILWNGGNRACYSPSLDLIQLPARDSFESAEAVYGTQFHEMGHSTGHEKRLGRTGVVEGQHFGSDSYGREELVAEMTAAMLSAEAGIAPAVIPNATAYLASWIRTIKEDPRVILTAAAQAQKASDYILGRNPTD